MMNMMLKGVCVLLGALVIAGAQSVHAEETVRVPRQPYELCFADSLNESNAPNGIESGWEIDNRAGRPRTELGSSGVLSDVMTDEHSRLIRYFNVVSEGSIDLQFQVNYVYNFNGNVLSLNDADGNSIYRLVTSEGRFAFQQPDGSLTYVTQETCMAPYKVIFRVTADLDTGMAHTWINNVDCGTSALLGSSIRSLSFETSDETLNETQVIGGYVQANYAVYESFDDPVSVINCEFENANQLILRNQAMELPDLCLSAGKQRGSHSSFGRRTGAVCRRNARRRFPCGGCGIESVQRQALVSSAAGSGFGCAYRDGQGESSDERDIRPAGKYHGAEPL